MSSPIIKYPFRVEEGDVVNVLFENKHKGTEFKHVFEEPINIKRIMYIFSDVRYAIGDKKKGTSMLNFRVARPGSKALYLNLFDPMSDSNENLINIIIQNEEKHLICLSTLLSILHDNCFKTDLHKDMREYLIPNLKARELSRISVFVNDTRVGVLKPTYPTGDVFV